MNGRFTKVSTAKAKPRTHVVETIKKTVQVMASGWQFMLSPGFVGRRLWQNFLSKHQQQF